MILDYCRQQWRIFSDREKSIAIIGSTTIVILFVYFVLWCPLSDLVAQDKAEFQSQKKLLIYFQTASHKIQLIRASGIQVGNHKDDNLLALVEKTLSQEKLSLYLKQVQQPHQNTITLTFNNVPFQPLMRWLQKLITTEGVHIQQFKAYRLSTPGAVNATIVLAA